MVATLAITPCALAVCGLWGMYACRYGKEEHEATVATTSRTVYVGNLSFVTTDRQLYELFSRVGPVENVIMGLNRVTKEPAGFCFIVCVAVVMLVV